MPKTKIMKPLIVLIVSFLISSLVTKLTTGKTEYQLAARIAMAIMLVFTAIGHFVYSNGMAAMVPNLFPRKTDIVIFTGVMEIIFAIGLLLPNYNRLAGFLIIAFFLLILPSNIKAAIENINYQTGTLDGPGINYLWFRIPLQAFFIL